MKSSTRNQFAGIISHIENESNHVRVGVDCKGRTLWTHISPSAARSLNPLIGQTAVIMVKAQTLILITDPVPFRLSSENQLECQVAGVEVGAVNNVITLDWNGLSLAAAITISSSEWLDLHEGQTVTAVFNACDTVLAVL